LETFTFVAGFRFQKSLAGFKVIFNASLPAYVLIITQGGYAVKGLNVTEL
jgi:hypothetical protein